MCGLYFCTINKSGNGITLQSFFDILVKKYIYIYFCQTSLQLLKIILYHPRLRKIFVGWLFSTMYLIKSAVSLLGIAQSEESSLGRGKVNEGAHYLLSNHLSFTNSLEGFVLLSACSSSQPIRYDVLRSWEWGMVTLVLPY